MTNDDFKKLKTVVKEEVSLIVKKEVSESEKRLKGEISASGKRLQHGFERKLKNEISNSEKRLKKEISASASQVMTDIGQFMESNLFPMINEKADKSDIDRLERKLDRYADTTYNHESRIKDIERIPVIAHELRFKKSKANQD